MVQIRVMGMLVDHRIMPMPVCVRLGFRIVPRVIMLVMLLMKMRVIVLHRLVTVDVFVMLG